VTRIRVSPARVIADISGIRPNRSVTIAMVCSSRNHAGIPSAVYRAYSTWRPAPPSMRHRNASLGRGFPRYETVVAIARAPAGRRRQAAEDASAEYARTRNRRDELERRRRQGARQGDRWSPTHERCGEGGLGRPALKSVTGVRAGLDAQFLAGPHLVSPFRHTVITGSICSGTLHPHH
jgi:hypothetical protein